MSRIEGAFPPPPDLAPRNILTKSEGIISDPTPLDLANTRSGTGAYSFQVIVMYKPVPNVGCYSIDPGSGLPNLDTITALGLINSGDQMAKNINVLT